MENIIEFKNVNLGYVKNKNILENINLNIPKSKMVAVVGKSGIGKTTFFKSILDRKKIITGDVKIFDKDLCKITKKDFKKIINKIGFLTQESYLIEFDNVFNNLKRMNNKYKNWFYRLFSILTKEQKNDLLKILDELNILDKTFTLVSELSTGEKQRVEIARVLFQKAQLILADEPTSNLDYHNANNVLEILKNINLTYQSSIIVITHDLDLLQKYFDYVVLIEDKHVSLMEAKEVDICKIKQMFE